MKKSLLVQSGICLLILAGSSVGPVFAASSFDGDMYNNLQTLQHSPQMTTTSRGAEGPIRSVDVQPAAGDIYQSLSQYHEAQMFTATTSDRGAQGRAASEADMAMARNEQEWRQMVGIFYGSD